MTQRLTPEQIRQLDGPILTRLAWELGLAPSGADLWGDEMYDFSGRELWEPHRNLVQADAVFRRLREYGWEIGSTSRKSGGHCRAWQITYDGESLWCTWPWDGKEQSEAHALLLVSVMTRTRFQEGDRPAGA